MEKKSKEFYRPNLISDGINQLKGFEVSQNNIAEVGGIIQILNILLQRDSLPNGCFV